MLCGGDRQPGRLDLELPGASGPRDAADLVLRDHLLRHDHASWLRLPRSDSVGSAMAHPSRRTRGTTPLRGHTDPHAPVLVRVHLDGAGQALRRIGMVVGQGTAPHLPWGLVRQLPALDPARHAGHGLRVGVDHTARGAIRWVGTLVRAHLEARLGAHADDAPHDDPVAPGVAAVSPAHGDPSRALRALGSAGR